MINPEQMFYVKVDNDGSIIGQIVPKAYNKLSDDDKKNFQQVFVDQDHLAGWGKYWYTAFYKDGALQYNPAWPKDNSDQINKLSDQVKSSNQKVTDLQNQLTNADNQIDKATSKIKELGHLDMILQAQVAKNNDSAQGTKKVSPVANNSQSNNQSNGGNK